MVDQSKVVVGFPLGSGFLKVGAYDVAEGSAVDIGYTVGGAEIQVERTYYEKKVDNELGVLDLIKTSEKATLKISIAESTLANLAIAMDYPSTAVASTTLSIGGGSTVNYKTLYLNVNGANGGTRKYTFHKAVVTKGGGHKYEKDKETLVDCEFEILQDTTKTALSQLFTCVETGADTTAPTIAMTTPVTSGTVVKNTKGTVLLTITETNAMNENTIVYGDTVQILNVTDTTAVALVAGTIAYDPVGKTITFTPTSNWTASDKLQVVVTTGLADNAGNKLASTFLGYFTVTA